MLTLLELISEEEDEPEILLSRLAEVDNFFINLHKPENYRFDEPENLIVQYEKQFENITSILLSNGCPGIGESTTFEYYSRLDYFKSQQKPK